MSKTPEGKIKEMIKRRLFAEGFVQVGKGIIDADRFFWMPHQGMYSVHGVSDFILCSNGVFGAIEAKTDRGKETVHQKDFGALVTHSLGVYSVVRTEQDMDEFLKYYLTLRR